MIGPPHASQKTVLARTRRKRWGVVPPLVNVRLAIVTPIQAAMPRSAMAAPATRHGVVPEKNQSLNQLLFESARTSPDRYHGGLRSCAPRRLISKIRGCQIRKPLATFSSILPVAMSVPTYMEV